MTKEPVYNETKLLKGCMQKIKTFLRSFVLSCTSPKYYAEIIRTRFSFSLKYLLVFQFLTTVIISAVVLVPLAAFNVPELLNSVKNVYPSDLDIAVQDGRLSINQPLPYRIPLPAVMQDELTTGEIREEMGTLGDVQYLAVFESDENIQGAADVYAQDAFVVFTETSIYVQEDAQEGLRVYPVPEGENFELNRGVVDQALNTVAGSEIIQKKLYIPFIAVVLLLVVLPIMIVASLVMVAVYGFFVWLMTKVLGGMILAGQTLSYMKAVQVSIHSLTLINVADAVFKVTGHGDVFGGWIYFLAFLVWTGFVLHQSFHQKRVTGSVAVATPARTRVTTSSRKVVAKPAAKKAKKRG